MGAFRLKTAEESQNKLRLDKVGLEALPLENSRATEAQVKELELKVEAKGSSADRLFGPQMTRRIESHEEPPARALKGL